MIYLWNGPFKFVQFSIAQTFCGLSEMGMYCLIKHANYFNDSKHAIKRYFMTIMHASLRGNLLYYVFLLSAQQICKT